MKYDFNVIYNGKLYRTGTVVPSGAVLDNKGGEVTENPEDQYTAKEMKALLDKNSVKYSAANTKSDLYALLEENGLIPEDTEE